GPAPAQARARPRPPPAASRHSHSVTRVAGRAGHRRPGRQPHCARHLALALGRSRAGRAPCARNRAGAVGPRHPGLRRAGRARRVPARAARPAGAAAECLEAPRPAEVRMSLQGILADFPVADVFQLIAQQRKTGVLEIERRGRALLVFFLEGQVLSARPSETRPDGSLAGYLLRAGALSESALSDARKLQEQTLEPLVPTLLRENLVARADLEQVSKLATGETIFELFLWDEGRFAFRAEDLRAGPVEKPVPAEMVLLDALRMRDEWVSIQNWLPDLSVVVAPTQDVEAFR